MGHFLKILASFGLIITNLQAKDLGVYGNVFPILETSLLEYIKGKMKNLSEDDLVRLQTELQDKYIKRISEPPSVGLLACKSYRCFYYDPTICTSSDIKDYEGKIIVAKGTSYNPLKVFALNETLLFFDGENPKHLEWAKKQNQGKWILTNGKPIDLEKAENRPVYFDQMGKISKQLGIQAIPAQVVQEDLRLKIEEVPCL
ncbi:MAG: type-F conjugative transfer system protein TraW [Parachlamydia sp.]|nr:MAG: type-F conjugative transfer system protein TraW [Parachlamydia sp.]